MFCLSWSLDVGSARSGSSFWLSLWGFAIPKDAQEKVTKFSSHGQPAELKHSSVVIAAITSCTNTSNPNVMLGAGLVAKKACELGLEGFHIVGYGCTTCIRSSGDLDESVASAIADNDIVPAIVLSRNQNFEGCVHPITRDNYLTSPPLVVAYALAGTDVWNSNEEIAEVVQSSVLPEMFKSTYEAITKGNPIWNQLSVPSSSLYSWDPKSTYIYDSRQMKTMMSP